MKKLLLLLLSLSFLNGATQSEYDNYQCADTAKYPSSGIWTTTQTVIQAFANTWTRAQVVAWADAKYTILYNTFPDFRRLSNVPTVAATSTYANASANNWEIKLKSKEDNCILKPVCTAPYVLDESVNPPVCTIICDDNQTKQPDGTCKDNCNLPDLQFPPDDSSSSYTGISSEPQICVEDDTYFSEEEQSRVDCVSSYRCKKTPKPCELPDIPYPATDPDYDYTGALPYDGVTPITCTGTLEFARYNCIESQSCKTEKPLDSDGDGIPDTQDTDDDNDGYSDEQENREFTDPTNANDNGGTDGTGSSPDGGGSNSGGTSTPGIKLDSDRDGFSDEYELANGTDPFDPTSNSATNGSGGTPDVSPGGDTSGSEPIVSRCAPGQYLCNNVCQIFKCDVDSVANDCPAGFIPAPDYSISSNCIPDTPPEENPADDCNHYANYLGYPFKTISNSAIACRSMINSNGGYGSIQLLSNCSQGSAACFFPDPGTPPDTNNTAPAQNNNGDDVLLEQLIINNKNIDEESQKMQNFLDSIRKGANQNSQDEVNSVNNMSNRLGSELTALNQSLNQQAANDALQELTDKAEADKDKDDLGDTLDRGQGLLDGALATFLQSKNDLISLANGFTAPTISIPGGDCMISTPIWSGAIFTLDLSSIALMRPYVQFVLNLILLFMTLKFYTIIARDITQYFLGGN